MRTEYCIKCNDFDKAQYVDINGNTTIFVKDILVSKAFNVLWAACEYWNNRYKTKYKVVEFDVDKIREDFYN